MANETASLDLQAWLQSPAGRYLLAWEAARLDAAVVDVFGFHALQLGWPALPALQANRMPQRWLALEAPGADLQCDFDALPFPENSLDLLVLPHTLEMASDPHHRLREAARVLRPEGRLLLLGFNPVSLWGWRAQLSPALPPRRQWIGYWRLRDWLRLLSFDINRAQFGAYAPAFATEPWLARSAWLDRMGPTWWPVFGAVYFIEATKRSHGMRLVGLSRQPARAARWAHCGHPFTPRPCMSLIKKPEITIYTDGACKGNPGPGGWGAWLIAGEHRKELCGGQLGTTNNQMEMTAVIEALSTLKRSCKVQLYTDSEYVLKGMTEWMPGWVRRGWRTAAGQPVKNAELWQRLAALCALHEIDWHWIKGHAGHEGNEKADQLANQGVAMALKGKA